MSARRDVRSLQSSGTFDPDELTHLTILDARLVEVRTSIPTWQRVNIR